MSQTAILSNKSGHLPLQVVFNGQNVTTPYITHVRLGNTGKVELKADDFDKPVSISFDKSILLQVLVSGRSSEDIDPDLVQTSNSISFTPSLLNPREWIEYQLITDGQRETPTVYARVAGNGSASIDSLAQRRKRIELNGLVVSAVGLLFTVAALWLWSVTSWLPTVGLGIIMLGYGIMHFASASAWSKFQKSKKPKKPFKWLRK